MTCAAKRQGTSYVVRVATTTLTTYDVAQAAGSRKHAIVHATSIPARVSATATPAVACQLLWCRVSRLQRHLQAGATGGARDLNARHSDVCWRIAWRPGCCCSWPAWCFCPAQWHRRVKRVLARPDVTREFAEGEPVTHAATAEQCCKAQGTYRVHAQGPTPVSFYENSTLRRCSSNSDCGYSK